MNELERIQELYRGYLAEAEEVLRTKKVTDGLWGFGKHPADHPCHGKFLGDLEAALGELADLPSAQIREILAYVYRAPLEKRRDPSIHWLLIAAHKLTLPLLDRLDPADARALGERYGADYPRRTRLPAQDQVFAALKG